MLEQSAKFTIVMEKSHEGETRAVLSGENTNGSFEIFQTNWHNDDLEPLQKIGSLIKSNFVDVMYAFDNQITLDKEHPSIKKFK